MYRFLVLGVLVAVTLPFTIGCATKKYVRNQTTPIVNNVNELDDQTAQNTRDIKDTDSRAQQGISQVNSKAAAADQKALAAGQTADQANQSATQAANRVTSLAGTVENLDNYKSVSQATVLFGFDKSQLTSSDKQKLDAFASQLQNQKHYILQIEGYTDSTGPAQYNYQLSQRRADSVIRYLAQKYDVPAYKIFLIGLGKDNPAARNTTVAGRAKNRRVDVRLMENGLTEAAQTSSLNQQQPVQPQ